MKIKQDLDIIKRLISIVLMLIFIFLYITKVKANDLTVEINAKELIKSEVRININSLEEIHKEVDNKLMFNEEKKLIVKVPNELLYSFEAKGYKVIGCYDNGIFYTIYELDSIFKTMMGKETLILIIIIVITVILIYLSFVFQSYEKYEIGCIFFIIGSVLAILSVHKLSYLLQYWFNLR